MVGSSGTFTSFTAVNTDVPVAADVQKQSVVTAAFIFQTNVYENDS